MNDIFLGVGWGVLLLFISVNFPLVELIDTNNMFCFYVWGVVLCVGPLD